MNRQPVPPGTRVLLAHTRFATQGHEGFMENNHPIRRGPFYLVHNGHVWNDDKLFEKAERQAIGRLQLRDRLHRDAEPAPELGERPLEGLHGEPPMQAWD